MFFLNFETSFCILDMVLFFCLILVFLKMSFVGCILILEDHDI